MKTKYSLIVLVLLVFSLSLNAQNKKEKIKVVADSASVDSTEYELIVLDPGFETWLITKSRDFHSESYYRTKNLLYVNEWNSRFMSPASYGDIYDCYIDYDPGINYGYDFNFRLYYYFKYFEEVNRVKILQ